MKSKTVLAAQRNLQYRSEQLEKNNAEFIIVQALMQQEIKYFKMYSF